MGSRSAFQKYWPAPAGWASLTPPAWLTEYRQRVDDNTPLNPVFRHGFLHRIAAPLADIDAQWSWLREREPIRGMEVVVDEHVPEQYRTLSSPTASWRTLAIRPTGWFTGRSVGNALRWGFAELRELDLSGCDVGYSGCRMLANLDTDLADLFTGWTAPPPLPEGQLSSLTLHGCGIFDEGARTLFAAKTLSALEELVISQCRLKEEDTLTALRSSPCLTGLRRLSLAGNKELGGKLAALAGWDVLPRLESLAVPQTATADDIAALFPEPSAALRALDLSSARGLLKNPEAVANAAVALTKLDLGTTSAGDKAWATLLAAPSTRTVLGLEANRCSLSDRAIDALTNSPLERLVALDLSSNKLSDKGLQQLAEWPGLRYVTRLRIGNNRKLGLPGYRGLIDSPHFNPVALDIGKSADGAVIAALRERFGKALVVRSS